MFNIKNERIKQTVVPFSNIIKVNGIINKRQEI